MKACKTLLLLCWCLCTTYLSTHAQTTGIKGIVSDTTNRKKVEHAVVALIKPGDSSLYCFTRTGADGSFFLPLVVPGKYVIMVSRSRFAEYTETLEVPQGGMMLAQISLTPISKILQEVIVRSGSTMRMKGDTAIYTADSFKVDANANVEELLKRLPGIQVDRDGKITTMGEVITKVLVDGEEFFGDDPGMVVKNLRADAVKEVQVFDKKSDQAAFSGIDDGEKTKTINLKLKEESKNGYFGKIELEGGLQQKIGNRYNNSAMINAFKGKRKMAAYAMTGNIGKSSLDWSDRSNFGGDTYELADGLGGDDNFDNDDYVDASNGFSKNLNTGLHYSNRLTDKHSINTSAKYSKLNYYTGQNIFFQTIVGDSVFTENSSTSNQLRKQQYKLKMNTEWNTDSMNVFTLTAMSSYKLLEAGTQTASNTVNKQGVLLNESSRARSSRSNSQLLAANLLWKHRFKKLKRTLSWENQVNFSQTDATGFLLANNRFYTAGILNTSDVIDQFKTTDNGKTLFGSKLVYTEPMGKNFSAAANYSINYALVSNEQLSFVKSIGDKYEDRVDSLSNEFRQQIITHRGGVSIRYITKKINSAIGVATAATAFLLNDLSRSNNYHYNFNNFFPSVKFLYTIRKDKTVLLEYRGFTMQPSLNQLQPLRENTNPLNQYIGNPALSQSFSHRADFNYDNYNQLKSSRFYLRGDVTFVENAFSQKVSIDNTGKRTTQPVNVSGVVNSNVSVYYRSGIKKWKINYDINYGFGFSRMNDFVNSIKNKSTRSYHRLGMGLFKYKKDAYNIILGNFFSWNINRSSLNSETVSYLVFSCNITFDYYFTSKLFLSNTCFIGYRQRTSAFDRNNNNVVWNTAINQKMLRQALTIKMAVNDVLNQNNNISRFLTSNSLSETVSERLQRYWLLSVTWNFKNGGKSSEKKKIYTI